VDPPRVDADHLLTEVRPQLVRADEEFGLAADVDTAYLPGAEADDVVDDQGDLRVLPQVAPLLRRTHRIAADQDRPVVLREEADGVRLRLALGVDGGQSAQPLRLEVRAFGLGEFGHDRSQTRLPAARIGLRSQVSGPYAPYAGQGTRSPATGDAPPSARFGVPRSPPCGWWGEAERSWSGPDGSSWHCW
jgi:hypothetical protein